MQDQLDLAPAEEREILNQIRNDHELVARLKITPQELETLSKCALLGTLTSKHDMLFILRQIREATGTAIDGATVIAQPPPIKEEAPEEPAPDLIRVAVRATPAVMHEPASLQGIIRRRVPEQFGILFWMLVLVVGLVWNVATLMMRWRDNFTAALGEPIAQASTSDTVYSSLDHFNVLLWSEVLFVAGIAVAMYVNYRRRTRRFKVRPGRRYR
jgi:hypothetical protein